MKMLAEYLEKAIIFERMAAEEKDAKLKATLKSKLLLIETSLRNEQSV